MKDQEHENSKSSNNTLANWTELRGRIKKEFPNLTDTDLQFMAKGKNELIGRLQIKSGKTKDQIRNWMRSTAKIM